MHVDAGNRPTLDHKSKGVRASLLIRASPGNTNLVNGMHWYDDNCREVQTMTEHYMLRAIQQNPRICTSKHLCRPTREVIVSATTDLKQRKLQYFAGLATTSSNILIADHNSVKRRLKVIDCIVLNAEYWCPYGTSSLL